MTLLSDISDYLRSTDAHCTFHEIKSPVSLGDAEETTTFKWGKDAINAEKDQNASGEMTFSHPTEVIGAF